MPPINSVRDVLLEKRDREVLRAASPVVAATGSPRSRWSPLGGGSPRKWSPNRWSPTRLSPSSSGSSRRRDKNYSPLEGDEEAEENLPSPTARARFSMSTNRQRGLNDRSLSPSGLNPTSEQASSTTGEASPIFRFKLQTVGTGTEAILPGHTDSRNQEDDFDMLVKERQQGSVRENLNRTFDSATPTPPVASSVHLHEMCANISTLDDLLRVQTFVKGNPYHSSHVDLQGRTPLHVFSYNKVLATAIGIPHQFDSETHEFLRIHEQTSTDPDAAQLEKHVLRFLITDLLPAYPGAMMVRDNESNIPFEKALIEWIKESHQRGVSNDAGINTPGGFSYSTAMHSMWDSTVKLATRTSSLMASGFNVSADSPSKAPNDMERGDSRSAIFSPDRAMNVTDDGRERPLSAFVKLTPQARFTLSMLSAVVDQLERYQSPKLLRQSRARPNATGESFLKAHRGLAAYKQQYGSINIVDSVVETIASIKDLMITILLIEDDTDREFALASPIVRRIMMSQESVGPWLTKMLQSRERHFAQRAVDYLKMVSAELTKPKPIKYGRNRLIVDDFRRKLSHQLELHQLLTKLANFRTLSLPSLPSTNVGSRDASTTFIVKQVLNRMMARPFAASVIICDILFLAMLIVGFRYAVNMVISGAPINEVLQSIYVANTGIFYFIIREIGKTVSLFQISVRARSYFLSFWNLIDATAIILALASSIAMRSYFAVLENGLGDDSTWLRGLLAVTTGFLWLRVLSLLKAINIQLATFVLAILQISKDIIWFCVIMATLVVSFSQMFFTLLAPASCADGDEKNQVCKPTEYLLRSYTILLGQFGTFEREQFTSSFSVFLLVCYSFLATVVLLNVLIAIASDSYDKCLLRSQHLFGRARVMLIAELVAFQNLLTTTDYNDSTTPKNGLYNRLRSSGRWIRRWSRASILFFSLSMLVMISWTLAELLGYSQGEQQSNILFSLASVIVNVGLFSIIMAFLAAASANRNNPLSNQTSNRGIFQGAMFRLLGVPSDPNDPHYQGSDDHGWNGKVNYLQQEMKRIADDHRALANQQIRTMEHLVNQTEMRLKSELELLEDQFVLLRDSLLVEMKGTKQTNQYVTVAVQELRHLMSVASSSAQTTHRPPVPSEVNVDTTRVLYPRDEREA